MITQVFLGLLLGSMALSGALKDSINMNESKDQVVAFSWEKEVVTLGGGCFWCIESIFEELEGVEQAESGYSGGWVDDPTYQQVCTGKTGHAEVVQVTFDPKVISLKEILKIFFTVHDPTTLNRQGPDVGTQYRSVIFYRSNEQKAVAEQVIQEIQTEKLWSDPIVTEIVPFKVFYKAEDFHQEYYKLNPGQAYCRFIIAPKVKKFREHYRDKLKRK
ncbi:MAG: peptide methionine sulfoxide reductase [Candidatus Brocadia sinica]|uniref:Peptide methionine sulfoxide reductase MsrA n=2 Tax=Candidatus Brocadiaceae TaxID=1127830 RepID=A0ABQ0K2B0_9BACT|nr:MULTISPECIES: peptide-methionine (S)-S-oxide reductase MsrA [Brocadia]KXK30764.1 MAG: peptide methionine sulfoxide reductase [Candidatus Brocadia sinica]MCK6469378.1 peptide-methionine (S)-S-oxide reductase MsrA [Candidatus Brocadia sinica]GAN34887.1 peptide-methionine S-S-oxide reductase [Candidatus Brocadia sinica JPN1]GIK11903.1 MAG: peptide methionine sulfoxide reductase MsrA [Candidatus Brocadia sinica]GJQ16741.1 MAG: peptide methionine sulfoxide reductase MsrA [Candidatus Brocadia sin